MADRLFWNGVLVGAFLACYVAALFYAASLLDRLLS